MKLLFRAFALLACSVATLAFCQQASRKPQVFAMNDNSGASGRLGGPIRQTIDKSQAAMLEQSCSTMSITTKRGDADYFLFLQRKMTQFTVNGGYQSFYYVYGRDGHLLGWGVTPRDELLGSALCRIIREEQEKTHRAGTTPPSDGPWATMDSQFFGLLPSSP